MIINCIKCNKNFEVSSSLIPSTGRTLQCGSCGHKWFFTIDKKQVESKLETEVIKIESQKNDLKSKESYEEKEIIEKKKNFSFGKAIFNFFSYIIIIIISLISLFIIFDTFQTPLINYFPNLEQFLYNFYESIKDISLFIKDLIK
jgi:predicted Zn finger-like uncharacterized protein